MLGYPLWVSSEAGLSKRLQISTKNIDMVMKTAVGDSNMPTFYAGSKLLMDIPSDLVVVDVCCTNDSAD